MKVQPFSKMSSTMQKRRLKVLLTVPKSFEGFKAALVGDQGKIDHMRFFREVVKAGNEFAIIFTDDVESELLEKISYIQVDAMFKVVPKKFYQLLTVHCVVFDCLVPIYYSYWMNRKPHHFLSIIGLILTEMLPSFLS